eukprot:4579797-Prymnesium_polylepis.1
MKKKVAKRSKPASKAPAARPTVAKPAAKPAQPPELNAAPPDRPKRACAAKGKSSPTPDHITERRYLRPPPDQFPVRYACPNVGRMLHGPAGSCPRCLEPEDLGSGCPQRREYQDQLTTDEIWLQQNVMSLNNLLRQLPGSESQVLQVLAACPHLARAQSKRAEDLLTGSQVGRIFPLHIAARYGASAPVIRALLAGCPFAAMYACECAEDGEDENHEYAEEKNERPSFALHLALQTSHPEYHIRTETPTTPEAV